MDGACTFLDSINWLACFSSCVTIDDYWGAFLAVLNIVISHFVPLVRSGRSFRYPRYIRRLLQRKRRANLPSHWATSAARARYRALCVRCSKSIKRFEVLREQKILENGNLRGFYSYIKNKRGLFGNRIAPLKRFDGSLAVSDSDKVFILNNHFSSVFTVDNGTVPPFDSRCSARLCNVLIPPFLVYDKLRRLKPSLSSGPDGIPKLFLKNFALQLFLPLSRIFEFS
ncbi:MAG: hypothetical protein GY821_16005, partial [Gammaproteobacteria bacterium]|nr:hypothetical protein [Gammaproteobacteria bacterium]